MTNIGSNTIKKKYINTLAAALAAFTVSTTQAADRKPNVIFFLVDDTGWMDCEPYGSKYYETPNLTRLAEQGVRFTQAYALSQCSPSRASIMSGQAVARHGITSAAGHSVQVEKELPPPASRHFMRPEQITLAEALRDAGYATAHLGKWHLGVAPEHQPAAQGFDTVFSAEPSAGPPGSQPGGFVTFRPTGLCRQEHRPSGSRRARSPTGRRVNISPTV
jgi:arylsulfatase A-like enzyme